VNDYFQGAVNQLIEKGQHLISIIPTGLSWEFRLLEKICRDKLIAVLKDLEELINNSELLLPQNQPERLRQFKRAVREMDRVQTIGIAALERAKEGDRHLNRYVERVRKEIIYPILPPVVTPLSQSYFQTYADFSLMRVPLSEGNFLLHLPDMYHELAHLLLLAKYETKVKPFIDAFMEVINIVTAYFGEELEKESRRQGPELFTFYLNQWSKYWIINWAVELFCDLFAVYTLGPAYAWSHLHLSATRGEDPFAVPTLGGFSTHPADAARMTSLLHGLTLIGFSEKAAEIEGRWEQLVSATGKRPEPEFRRCYPKHILEAFAEKALQGVQTMGCRIVNPGTTDIFHDALNGAWDQFWRDPATYAQWEKSAVKVLRERCSASI
jgi:hypothetical protein